MPNPFNTTSVVRVDLERNAALSFEVVNLMGQLVLEMDRGVVNSGTHYFTIEASELPSGIYFYKLSSDTFIETRKMILMK